MRHPLIGKALYSYSAVWVVIIAIHAAVLHVYYQFPLSVSLSEALVFNMLVAGMGLSYWYVVQYISPNYQGIAGIILSHFVGVFVAIALACYAGYLLQKSLFPANDTYLTFLWETFFWRMITGVLFLALIIMIYYLLQYNNNLKKKEQEELALQNMLRHSELEMLKFQINPHFIFNSLNSISSLTITDAAKARDMVIKLSDFLRSSLGTNNPDKHLLKDEFEQMNLYLDIEKVRFGERLSAVNEVDEKCLSMTLPNMILQPLYENAIKYGIYEQLENVEIKTRCQCEEGHLKISVSNNYDSHAVTQKGKGIGLKNIRNRLKLIYGVTGLITIEKSRTIFTVHLLIPQNLE